MKYIVTHTSPDWDAIGSIWLIRKYLPGWQEAQVRFVPAGQRIANSKYKISAETEWKQVTDEAIEIIQGDEYMHVDTGLGPLDHHQNNDTSMCGASKTWEYIKNNNAKLNLQNDEERTDVSGFTKEHKEAVDRIVQIIVAIDHFREVYWDQPTADYQEFSLIGVLDGLKLYKPEQDSVYVEFGSECLQALVHQFENRIWAEKEIKEKGIAFRTKWGKAIGFETINDSVLKLAQKMGYNIVVRKDPRKGYVRIKALPEREIGNSEEKGIDLTLAYENLRKIDPDATWFLHVSKKMLLNGTPKNPSMMPTKLSLPQIIEVLKNI